MAASWQFFFSYLLDVCANIAMESFKFDLLLFVSSSQSLIDWESRENFRKEKREKQTAIYLTLKT